MQGGCALECFLRRGIKVKGGTVVIFCIAGLCADGAGKVASQLVSMCVGSYSSRDKDFEADLTGMADLVLFTLALGTAGRLPAEVECFTGLCARCAGDAPSGPIPPATSPLTFLLVLEVY